LTDHIFVLTSIISPFASDKSLAWNSELPAGAPVLLPLNQPGRMQ